MQVWQLSGSAISRIAGGILPCCIDSLSGASYVLLGHEKSGFSLFGGHPDKEDKTQFDTAARECTEELCSVLGQKEDFQKHFLFPLNAKGCELWDGSYAVFLGVYTHEQREEVVQKFHRNRWGNGLQRELEIYEKEKDYIQWFPARLIYLSCIPKEQNVRGELQNLLSLNNQTLRPFFVHFMARYVNQCEETFKRRIDDSRSNEKKAMSETSKVGDISGIEISHCSWRNFCLESVPFFVSSSSSSSSLESKIDFLQGHKLTNPNFHRVLLEHTFSLLSYFHGDRSLLNQARQNMEQKFPFHLFDPCPSNSSPSLASIPFHDQLACILAESLAVFRTTKEVDIYVIVPLFKETNRLRKSLEHNSGEDFVAQKILELSTLLEQQTSQTHTEQHKSSKSRAFVYFVDDQCPDNSGGAVEALLARSSSPLSSNITVRVLRRPLAFGRGRTTQTKSRKAGAVRFGLLRAVQDFQRRRQQRQQQPQVSSSINTERKSVFILTDADLSANLIQIGLLIEPLLQQRQKQQIHFVGGSRRLPCSLLEKKGNSNGSKLLSLLRRSVFPNLSHLTDTQVGFKAISAEAALELCGFICSESKGKRKGRRGGRKRHPILLVSPDSSSTTLPFSPPSRIAHINTQDMTLGFDIDIIVEIEKAFPGSITEVAIGWIDSVSESNVWRIGKAITFHEVVSSLSRAYRRHCSSQQHDEKREAFVRLIENMSVEQLDRLLFHFSSLSTANPEPNELLASMHKPRFELELYQQTPQCFYTDLDSDAVCSARKKGEQCPLTISFGLSSKGVFIVPQVSSRTLDPSSILRNMTRDFDCHRFSNANDLPVHVGYLSDYASFDRPGCPQPQNMPIKFPDSDYRLPHELAQFTELVQMVADFWHSVHPSPDKYYCYLSLSQSVVPPKAWQRRPHLHSDGFQSAWISQKLACDMSFTVSNVRPTLYYQQRFSTKHLDPARDNFFKDFEKRLTCAPIDCQSPYEITLMDAYTLHRANQNTSCEPVARTFVRMIFSVWKWDRAGNGHNPMFDYNWPCVVRENWSTLK